MSYSFRRVRDGLRQDNPTASGPLSRAHHCSEWPSFGGAAHVHLFPDVIPQTVVIGSTTPSGTLHAWVPRNPHQKKFARPGENSALDEERGLLGRHQLARAFLFLSDNDERIAVFYLKQPFRLPPQDVPEHAANVLVGERPGGSLEKAKGCRHRVRWCLVAPTDRISARRWFGDKPVRNMESGVCGFRLFFLPRTFENPRTVKLAKRRAVTVSYLYTSAALSDLQQTWTLK